MNEGKTRFIAVTLTEAEWRALRALKNDPSGWLKQQIDRALQEAGVQLPANDENPAYA